MSNAEMDGAVAEEPSLAEAPAVAEEAAPASEEAAPAEDTSVPGMPWSIDFGTFKCCIAAASGPQRQAEIVLDEEFSRADTPTTVSYQAEPARRFVGEGAAGKVVQAFATTFVEIPQLLLPAASDDAYPHCRHTVEASKFAVQYDGAQQLTASQITAALFSKLKATMEAKHPHLGPCVLSVSDQFDASQKKQILDAAAIAQLNVARLVSSEAAAVLTYCSRHPDAEGLVLVIDVGHNFSAASLTQYADEKATIVATASANVGASLVDQALFEHVAKKCKEDYKLDIALVSKMGQKVLKNCAATKKILSTIPQGVVNIDDHENNRDLIVKVTRNEMASICGSRVDPLKAMIEQVFAALPADHKIGSVEVVGGGSCIPMFQECITECLQKHTDVIEDATLRKTLDLATTCACGGALLAYKTQADERRQTSLADKLVELTTWDTGLAEVASLDEQQLSAAVDFEKLVQHNEAQFLAKETALNKFESMIYETRGLSEGKYSVELPIAKLEPILTAADEYYWGDAQDASVEQLEERQAAMVTQMKAEFPSYYERLDKEADEERILEEKRAIEHAAHQAAEAAELEASGVVRDTRKMPFADRVKLMMKNKEEGTELYKGGNLEPAAIRYTKALNHGELIKEMTDEEREELRKVRLGLYLNLAMVFGKMKKQPKVIDNCRYALEIDPKSSKALFRRATAYYEEKDFEKAEVDLTAAMEIEPVDSAVSKLLKLTQKALTKRAAKEKATYGKMFG